jgi:anthranilate synthase/phosphoribosyltransferase
MIVMIDNYDSFVYNLVQLFGELGADVKVLRNDATTVEQVRALAPSHIVISPGPCTPAKAGVSVDIIRELGPTIPTLGVCLGHEAIGVAFGAKLSRASQAFHGKTSDIRHDGKTLFTALDSPMVVGRYHSLALEPPSLPAELEVSAWAEDGTIQAIRHRQFPIEGVQFHPESVLTPQGRWLCENFLVGGRRRTTMRHAIDQVVRGQDLSGDAAQDVMKQILSGAATPAQIASLITALRLKGETVPEIAAFARVMRSFARKIASPAGPVVDTCGTGGDDRGTFNISTVAAIVAAGAGAKVAKHGNRSVSSRCGSADVLRELGVNITCGAELMERALAEVGLAFLFAPAYHGAMKHAIGPRREIGLRTVFNILGPLTNPAGATRQLLGVYDASLTERVAGVLAELGSERAFVVHGADGLDEITLTGPTRVTELSGGKLATYDVRPEDFGLNACRPEDLIGGSPQTNAQIARAILQGETGPKRDVVLLNAAAALVAAGLAEDITAGVKMAAASIDDGKAQAVLTALIETTHAG